MIRGLSLLIIGMFGFAPLFAQRGILPVNKIDQQVYLSKIYHKNSLIHSSIKPYRRSELASLEKKEGDKLKANYWQNREAVIYPISELGIGLDMDAVDRGFYWGSIGLGLRKEIGARWYVEAQGYKSWQRYPNYLQSKVLNDGVAISQGIAHANGDPFDLENFRGQLSFDANQYVNLSLAYDRNFIGDGYRSLLLSDYANNYLHSKLSVQVWKMKYVHILAQLKDFSGVSDPAFFNLNNKYASIHYLSWKISKWLNLSFFESVIWRGQDTLLHRGVDVNYLNPLIFFRPVEYSTGSTDNSIMAGNASILIPGGFNLYGQILLDEFLLDEFLSDQQWWANKYAVQAGLRYVDAFKIKNLSLLAEYNFIRPFTYTHKTSLESYGHYLQPMAHPMGANIKEMLFQAAYATDKWYFELFLQNATYGRDTGQYAYGGNVFRSYEDRNGTYGHSMAQGLRTDLISAGAQASYLILPVSNLRLEFGVWARSQNDAIQTDRSLQFWVGLRNNLRNTFRAL